MNKLFVIAPIRDVEATFRMDVEAHLAELAAQGYEIYYPRFDTNQVDDTGLRICQDNLAAIEGADKVLIAWDGRSKGCLFDLGMAFALGKRIVPIPGCFPEPTKDKSFASMIHHLNLSEVVDEYD
jgi:nucleoside 2-deoxyribosyltransferase